jgi:hypothetical protein
MPSFPLPFSSAEQAWQGPLHWVLQHTPSMQKPDAHSDGDMHTPPLDWSAAQ